MSESRIFYLAPDTDVPSWGNGLLYGHVRLLRELGFEAFALHRRDGFRFSWIEDAVPTLYLDSPGFRPTEEDLLVVPEVAVRDSSQLSFPGRRGVFVQGSFLMLRDFEEAIDYRELGFDFCLAVLPHVKEIVDRHFGLEACLVPPFLAPYFFASQAELVAPRERTIVAYSNRAYVDAGYPDLGIVEAILGRAVTRELLGWNFQVLGGMDHRATAELFKKSAILVNVNVLEAFNTTVPEAMAAGCIPICYEAYGGRDFLVNESNAFCFPNNHAYPLVEKVVEVASGWHDRNEELARMRQAGSATASTFRSDATRESLRECYSALLGARQPGYMPRAR